MSWIRSSYGNERLIHDTSKPRPLAETRAELDPRDLAAAAPALVHRPVGLLVMGYPRGRMREWLTGLTRPEDHLLWAWVAIAAGYAVIGVAQGVRARRGTAPAPAASADPELDSR